MKIAVDCHIPFIRGVFEPLGIVVSYDEVVDPRGADAMIIRTRTRCDKALLETHRPRIIATATIGFDHIDTQYCRQQGIAVAISAGCNAGAVADWVFAAMLALGVEDPTEKSPINMPSKYIEQGSESLTCQFQPLAKLTESPKQGVNGSSRDLATRKTMGIIGVGNVGTIVDRVARQCGFRTLRCDPPRQAAAQEVDQDYFTSLSELLSQSDIVTMHVPLNDETRGMAGADFFAQMKPEAIFLNASRGEVVDEQALESSHLKLIAIDVWCNEPHINSSLLNRVTIATPHIAGYSLLGKAMATAMAVRNVAKALGIKELQSWYPPEVTRQFSPESVTWNVLSKNLNYDIFADDRALRSSPMTFEQQRQSYLFRPQFLG